jgi:hypothetical protein
MVVKKKELFQISSHDPEIKTHFPVNVSMINKVPRFYIFNKNVLTNLATVLP